MLCAFVRIIDDSDQSVLQIQLPPKVKQIAVVQIVHPIISQVLFESACPFPNSFQG